MSDQFDFEGSDLQIQPEGSDEFVGIGELESVSLSLDTSAMDRIIREEMQRVDYAIRGAILSGYDGVDINRKDAFTPGIVSIEPWHRGDEPEEANGYRTERYAWDWFDNDRLKELAHDPERIKEWLAYGE